MLGRIWAQRSLIILTGGLVLLFAFLLEESFQHYLLFHSLSETFSIVVACGVFMFAWNSRQYQQNQYLLFVGIGFLFAAVLDVLHMLTYEGMGVYATPGANLSTQLWIAGRFLNVVTLLLAPNFIHRPVRVDLALGGFTLLTGLLVMSIFTWKVFPTCYIQGSGLTPFKKISEYLLAGGFLASLGLLWYQRAAFSKQVYPLLLIGIGLMTLTELFFTLYVGVESLPLVIGHFIRIIAFYLFYRAIIEIGLVRPYSILLRELKQNQNRLEENQRMLQQQQEVLERQAASLQQRNQDLDAFAHTVAHDLKSPMGSVFTAAQVLEDENASPQEVMELMPSIAGTMQRMAHIVDDLLLFAQVQKDDMPGVVIDMAEPVAAACERLAGLLKEHDGQILQPQHWSLVLGYAPWVEEIWVNYISNAIKYGGRPPCIELGMDAPEDGMQRFWVRDNGHGLSVEAQANLFQAFSPTRIRATGYGLGLSIVKRIVDKLGGQAGVESQVGQGSLFYFSLPVIPNREAETQPGLSAVDSQSEPAAYPAA